MISSEVQRTLVKSPPELWAELSDPAALARHLGELGEIRIVRTEPERVVEWAAENTTGTVAIKPSGWGTKVTLSVTRELAQPAPALETPPEAESAGTAAAEQAPALEPPPEETPAPQAAESVPAPTPEVEPIDTPEPISVAHAPEPEPTVETAAPGPEATTALETTHEPEPRRGFFARLFGRRRRDAPSNPAMETIAVTPAEPAAVGGSAPATPDAPSMPDASIALAAPATPDAFAAVRQVLEPHIFAAEHPFAAVPELKPPAPERAATEPVPEADPRQTGDIAAELLAAEEAGAEEVTAVLTAVLDRLGAAHHRPFSRS
jgi:hypothetical protein